MRTKSDKHIELSMYNNVHTVHRYILQIRCEVFLSCINLIIDANIWIYINSQFIY